MADRKRRCPEYTSKGARCGLREGHAGYHRSWQAKKQQAVASHSRAIEAKYGITSDDYWRLYRYQGGRCAICMIATGATKRLSVDHWHGCTEGHDPKMGCKECVRGLLCGNCNTYLGRVRDNPDAFRRGAEYLDSPPFQVLLKEFRWQVLPSPSTTASTARTTLTGARRTTFDASGTTGVRRPWRPVLTCIAYTVRCLKLFKSCLDMSSHG